MYYIIELLDGTLEVTGHAQDGAETWKEDSMEEAVESLILFAKQVNGRTITDKDISFGVQEVTPMHKLNIKWQHSY